MNVKEIIARLIDNNHITGEEAILLIDSLKNQNCSDSITVPQPKPYIVDPIFPKYGDPVKTPYYNGSTLRADQITC